MRNPPARRARKLSAVPAAAVLAVLAAACGPAHASAPRAAAPRAAASGGPASSQAAAAPKAGGPVQGVTVGVPSGWKSADFSRESLARAREQFALPSITQSQFNRTYAALASVHGIIAADTRHVTVLPGGGGDVVPSENAYCTSSGTGSAGGKELGELRRAAASAVKANLGTVTGQKDVTVSGVPAVETAFRPLSPAPGITEQALSISAAPRPEQACYMYLSYPAATIPAGVRSQALDGITYP